MTATLLLKIETQYNSAVFLPHNQMDRNKVTKAKLLKSRTPEFELFKIVFWFLEKNVIILNGDKCLLLDQQKAEYLSQQLRDLLAENQDNEQIISLINNQLQYLRQFLELQTTQHAQLVQHELQELYEQFYEIEGHLNVTEYQINTVYHNVKDNTYHYYTFAQLIQTYIFGEPFDATDENIVDIKQLTEFVDRAVVESPGFIILGDIQQLNEVSLNGKEYLRGNYHLCQQLAPILADAPLNEIQLLRRKKQYTDILEEVQKLKENCIVKQEQFYFLKQFIIDRFGNESAEQIQNKSQPSSPSRSAHKLNSNQNTTKDSGLLEQQQINTIEEYLEDLLKRLYAQPDFILFAQEGRLQGFDTQQNFTVIHNMFQILTNNFHSHDGYSYSDVLTDMIIKGDLTVYLDEQLQELLTKCTIMEVSSEIDPQHIILLANEYYTKYLLTENSDKYLRLSTDQRITEIVRSITSIYLYDEELCLYMADYNVLCEKLQGVLQAMDAYGVDLAEIAELQLVPEEEKHSISYKHNLMVSLLNCYNELVVKDVYFDNFLIKDAGHVLDKQCITRNLEGEYYELQINKPESLYVQYTLQLLLLFINFVKHPSSAMLAMVEEDLAELISGVQVLVNGEMAQQVAADVEVGKIPTLFAQHFFFKTFGNHAVDCKRCQYIVQSPFLLSKTFNLNCLQYSVKTLEVQLFQILSQFIILAYNEDGGVFNVEFLQIQSLEKQLQDDALFSSKANITFQPLLDVKKALTVYLENPTLKTIIKLIELLINTMKNINSQLYGVYFVFNKTDNFKQQLVDNLNNYQYSNICTVPGDVVFKVDIQMLIYVNKNLNYMTFNEFYDKYSDFVVHRNYIKHELQNLRQRTEDLSCLHPLLIKQILIKDDVYVLLPDDYDLKVIANIQPELHEVLRENKTLMHFFSKLVFDEDNQDVYYHYPVQQSQNMVVQKLEFVNQQLERFRAELMKFTGLTFAFMDQNSININHLEQNLNNHVSGKFTDTAVFIRIDYLLLFIANSGNVTLFSSKIQKDEARYLIKYNEYREEIIHLTRYVQLNQFQIVTFLNSTIIPDMDMRLLKNLQRFSDCVINTIGNKQVYFEMSSLIGNIDYERRSIAKNNYPSYKELMDIYVKYSEPGEGNDPDSQRDVLVYFTAEDANKLSIVELKSDEFMLLKASSMFQDEILYNVVGKQQLLQELVRANDLEDKNMFIVKENVIYDYLKILSPYALGDVSAFDFMEVQFNDSLHDVIFKLAIRNYRNKEFCLDLTLWKQLLQTDRNSIIEIYEMIAEIFSQFQDKNTVFQDSQIFFKEQLDGQDAQYAYGNYLMAIDILCDRKKQFATYKHAKLSNNEYHQWLTQLSANFGELILTSDNEINNYIKYMETVNFKNCYVTQDTSIHQIQSQVQPQTVCISKLMNLRQFVDGLYKEGENKQYKVYYSTDIDIFKYIQSNYSIQIFGQILNHLTKFEYLLYNDKQYKAGSEYDAIQQLLADKNK